MDSTIVLARSNYRESYSFNGRFFTEWGIRKIDTQEKRDSLIGDYGVRELYRFSNPFVSVRRKVSVMDNYISYGDWEIIDFADGEVDASQCIGDTQYYSAASLHPLHIEEVSRRNRISSLHAELRELEDRLVPHKFQKESNLKKEYREKYESELKSRKLFKKAEKGLLDPILVAAIKEPILAEYDAEESIISKRIAAIKLELM